LISLEMVSSNTGTGKSISAATLFSTTLSEMVVELKTIAEAPESVFSVQKKSVITPYMESVSAARTI